MQDDSSSETPLASSSASSCVAACVDAAPPLEPNAARAFAPGTSEDASLLSTVVVYSHAEVGVSESSAALDKRDVKADDAAAQTVQCGSLEELLVLLEVDVVDQIVFDRTVPQQERSYITQWARIFKPAVSCRVVDGVGPTSGESAGRKIHVA